METLRSKLIGSLQDRLKKEIAPQNPVKFLLDLDLAIVLDTTISVLYLYTRLSRGDSRHILMVEVASAIGHGVRNKFKLKKDSGIAVKAGAFLLYSFEKLGILKVGLSRATNNHQTYVINILDDDALSKLWDDLKVDKVEKLPSTKPYAPWTSFKHETGVMMVKTPNRSVLESLTPESHPIVFECLNKAQEIGWIVNRKVYDIFVWALRNKADAFADIWEIQNPEARASKIREAKAVGSIAYRFLGQEFYHLYTYDFRGRKYPNTAYFHEQGTDASRGMLLRADCKPVGPVGKWWLLVSIASNWAGDAGRDDGYKTDKIPLQDRAKWVLDNKEIILSYASDPKVHQGWMKADKPWQFLAACMEYKKIEEWEANRTDPNSFYCSHLEVYIDGSNNGSQHLSALTKDEITAPHVNLVPLDLPGDLYKYVADHVWKKIELTVEMMSPVLVDKCESFIDNLVDLKNQINEAPLKSERRKHLIDEIILFKKKNKDILDQSAPVFWNRIRDNKHRRKVVKRNVMTLPYGGTAYGLGQQQIDDARKHGIDQLMTMEHKWGSYIGREVFEDCRISLKRPMRLLSIFEAAGKLAEQENRFVKWTVPITNFPVVQHYVEGTVKKIYVQYGPPIGERNSTGYYENTLQLAVSFLENTKLSKKKQSQGASPNAIHSLDAAHLMLIVHNSSFGVTTIHDSYGCLLEDMSSLFRITRESFVQLYKEDPLGQLMKHIGGDISAVEIGNLDITLVLDSEYCFA